MRPHTITITQLVIETKSAEYVVTVTISQNPRSVFPAIFRVIHGLGVQRRGRSVDQKQYFLCVAWYLGKLFLHNLQKKILVTEDWPLL